MELHIYVLKRYIVAQVHSQATMLSQWIDASVHQDLADPPIVSLSRSCVPSKSSKVDNRRLFAPIGRLWLWIGVPSSSSSLISRGVSACDELGVSDSGRIRILAGRGVRGRSSSDLSGILMCWCMRLVRAIGKTGDVQVNGRCKRGGWNKPRRWKPPSNLCRMNPGQFFEAREGGCALDAQTVEF